VKTLWLPGAVGSSAFWRPVAACLRELRGSRQTLSAQDKFFSWPGLGSEPGSHVVRRFSDLVHMVLSEMDQPVKIIAQSMGGLIALKAALAAPDKVSRLVLVATSAGLPMSRFDAADWRGPYFKAYPHAPRWIGEEQEDLSEVLPSIEIPTLLLWGSDDRISPVPVGQRLQELMPNATLEVVSGGAHDLALTHATSVAALVASHFAEMPGGISRRADRPN
jgi:pimeloyl-ACP methyl ester carboxylesterase